jgi:TRAP transporter TAXI family solute receptor
MWPIANVVVRLASLPRRWLLIGSLLPVAFGYRVVFGPAWHKPPEPAVRNVLRLTVGSPSTMYGMLGEALQTIYQRRAPEIDLRIVPSTGSIDNVDAIQHGDADIGIAQAHVVYSAAMGQLSPAHGIAYHRLRGIAVLPLTPLILVAAPHSTIRHLSDLIGRRVGVGDLGSALAPMLPVLLGRVGIKQDMFHAEVTSSPNAVMEILAGRLDACFLMGYSPLVEIALAGGARIVPLHGRTIDQLRREYPFLRPTLITAGQYDTNGVRTIGVDRVLIARSDFDEQLVYQFTGVFFEALRELGTIMDSLRSTDLQLAPATPIPLHEGAARYYRIRELSR